MHRCRHHHLGHRPHPSVGPPAPLEAPRLGQRLHHLLDEEGIPPGPLADRLEEIRDRRVVAEQVAKQLLDPLRPEGQEGQLLVVRLAGPVRLVLGAEVHQQQRARAAHRLDDLGEEGVAPRVDPVQVVQQQDRGLPLAAGADQTLDEGEELALARLRGHLRRGALPVRNA